MAMILPAAGAWPSGPPENRAEPGLEHIDGLVQEVVEGHNYLAGYHLLGHGASHWPGRNTVPALAPGWMETASAVLITVGELLIVPRHAALGVRLYFRADSDAGFQIRVTCLDDASTTGVLAYGAGQVYSYGGLTYAATRGETLTTLRVELRALGTWAALYEATARDRDLTALTLP